MHSCKPDKDHVVLLHGMGRGPRVMAKMDSYLSLRGFCTHNIEYPSTRYPIIELAEHIFEQIKSLIESEDGTKVHFVGHSLGAILIRYLIKNYDMGSLGRVVMLAPPNHGSQVADFLKRFTFYKKRFGPAGQELASSNQTFFQSLLPTNFEVGIIAGNRTVDWLFSWFILPGENDGKVTVESTELEGMKDHLVMSVAHPFVPCKREVMMQTAFFLAHGYFQSSYAA